MSKVGILDSKEGKFFAGIIAEEIPVNGIWRQGLKMVLTSLINGLDDKVGDKIPSPWQEYTEELVTILYESLQDKVITEEEKTNILEKCSAIINEQVDVPLMNEQEEGLAFMFLLQSISSLIKGAFKKKDVL